MMNTERASINSLDTRIYQLKQDAEMARQRIQKLTTQLEAETRSLRLHVNKMAELRTTRNALEQSIERKQAIMSSRRRIPGEIWREIFLLLWESEFQRRNTLKRPFSVALQVGAVCREWRDLAQTTTRLWSILDYAFSLQETVKSRRERKLYHYLGHIGAATPYIILRNACSAAYCSGWLQRVLPSLALCALPGNDCYRTGHPVGESGSSISVSAHSTFHPCLFASMHTLHILPSVYHSDHVWFPSSIPIP